MAREGEGRSYHDMVIPIEDENVVNSDNINERMDDVNEMDLTNPNPEPKQAKPC